MCWRKETVVPSAEDDGAQPQQMASLGWMQSSNSTSFFNTTDIPSAVDELRCHSSTERCPVQTFCRNGGLCCTGSEGKYCMCVLPWTGVRCTEHGIHGQPSLDAGFGNGLTIIIVVVVLVCCVLIGLSAYVCIRRRRRSGRTQGDSSYIERDAFVSQKS